MWQALSMIPRQTLAMLALGAVTTLSGCSKEDVVGHYWDITASGVADTCTGQAANHKEKLDYRLVIEGQEAQVAIGANVFANGEINGCTVFYDSVIWAEERGEYDISWQIHGLAVINVGGGQSCAPPNGTDWDGEETFEVISSSDPSVSPGCEYTLALSGKYLEEVK